FVYRSTDSGKTWTEPVELDLAPFNRGGDGWTQGYQHPDGDVMITMTLRVVGADPEDITAGIHEHIYRSTDGGKTWSDRVLLHAHGAESSLLALRDSNKMLAIIRAQRFRFDSDTPELFKTFGTPPDGRIALKNGVLAESNDGGRTWGNPRLFTGFGDVPGELIQTPDGRIAALWLHRYPHPQGRVCVRISEDGGATWGDTQYVLFDGNGYSSSVVFDDGAIVTVCENTPLDAGGHPAGARSMVAALWRLPAR
ncbi:MAG: sialidase family protein, partial [Phycisphaeraceae bacterium]|nr:sialidase family protein [Phycisphaeraceae bacterium]